MGKTITQEYLHERLDYNPETGDFIWKPKAVTQPQDISWNARFAGTVAGRLQSTGYRQIYIGGRRYLAHRLAWLWMTGAMPVAEIDHRNGDRADNRFSNIREATRSQNCANRASSRDGLKGAYRHRARWLARICADGRHKHLGCYDTEVEAHQAYMVAATAQFGAFARGGIQ